MWPWMMILALLAADARPPASCVERLPGEGPAEALRVASAVFSGRVTGREWVREPFVSESGPPSPVELEQFRPGEGRIVEREWVLLTVHSVWKGDVLENTRMRTSHIRYPRGLRAGPEEHEWVFENGQVYMIYAYGRAPDSLATSICQRTRPLRYADEDMRVLGPGRPPRT